MPEIWAGVDIGKEHHHCVVINEDGERLLSRRVLNDETELLQLIGDVLEISTDVLWAVDLNHGGAALLIGLLLSHDQPMAYLTGLAVHRASATYKGEGKTDAKDAFVIADQARVRRDLGLLRPGDEIAVDLRTLSNRRLDAVFDRTRQINRLRAQLLEIFPALERSLDLVNKGPGHAADGLPDPRRDASRGREADRDVAEEPQGPRSRRAREDGRGGRPGPVDGAAWREAGRRHGGPPREGGDGLR